MLKPKPLSSEQYPSQEQPVGECSEQELTEKGACIYAAFDVMNSVLGKMGGKVAHAGSFKNGLAISLDDAVTSIGKYRIDPLNLTDLMSRIYNNNPHDKDAWKFTNQRLYPEAEERSKDLVVHQYEEVVLEHLAAIEAIFLGDSRGVDWSGQYDVSVPTVKNWRRKKQLDPHTAAEVYQQFAQQAVERATQQLRSTIDAGRHTLEQYELSQVEADDVCNAQAPYLAAFASKYEALYTQAKPVANAHQYFQLVYSKRLYRLSQHIIAEAPVIKQLQRQIYQWYDRPDQEIVDDLALECAERLWSDDLKRAIHQQLATESDNAVIDALRWLEQQLDGYQPERCQADHAAITQLDEPPRETTSQAAEPAHKAVRHSKPHEQKQAITEVQLDATIAPWLGEDGERLPPVDVLVDNGSGVLVLDCRTKAAKDIEHQMAGYETEEKQRGIVSEVLGRLTHYADAALNEHGLKQTHAMSRLSDIRHSSPYKAHTIWYNKTVSRNVIRVYVADVNVGKIPNRHLRSQLKKRGIKHTLLFVGACDKQHQLDMLQHITQQDRKRIRSNGAGSV